MPRYYDPDTVGGANDGTSWANAYTDFQTAVTAVTLALGPLYIRKSGGGSIVLGGTINFNTNSGSVGSLLRYVGCNTAGVVDGTRVVFSGNLGAYHMFTVTSMAWVSWENIACTSFKGAYVAFYLQTACNSVYWLNCEGYQAAGVGNTASTFMHNASAASYDMFFYDCQFHDMTSTGSPYYVLSYLYRSHCVRCDFINVYVGGYVYASSSSFTDCVFHACVTGVAVLAEAVFTNCVFDGCTTSGLACTYPSILVIGSRFTNNAVGISSVTYGVILVACTFRANGSDYSAGKVQIVVSGPTLTSDGYVNAAAHDFRIVDTDPARSVQIGQYIPTLAYRPSGLGIKERIWPQFNAPIIGA